MENNYNNQDNEEYNNEEEFCDNDIYLIELHKRLAMMKKDRKKAQQDASLLGNRLNLLKGEEEKVIYNLVNKPFSDLEKNRSY